MKLKLLTVLCLGAALALGQNLLTNGDFEQDLTVGWTYTDSGYGTHYADRQTGYQPDPDEAARVCVRCRAMQSGWCALGELPRFER